MKDLTKPFFNILPEHDGLIEWETNLPNDTIGDQAFEYDYDGSERKKWEEYVEELERKGEKGKLVYHKWIMQKNNMLDNSDFQKETSYPLESYKLEILDISS